MPGEAPQYGRQCAECHCAKRPDRETGDRKIWQLTGQARRLLKAIPRPDRAAECESLQNWDARLLTARYQRLLTDRYQGELTAMYRRQLTARYQRLLTAKYQRERTAKYRS